MRRAARESSHGKAAGVAKAIEHALKLQAPRVFSKLLAAVALVQIKTGLVAVRNVQRQLPVVFAQHQVGGTAAAQPASDFGQAFQAAAAGV